MGFRYLKNNLNLLKLLHKSSSVRTIPSSSSSAYKKVPNPPLIPLLYDHSSFMHPENPSFNIPKRWHVGHSHHHDQTSQEGERIFRLGLAADIGLTAGKALTGYLSGSTAIIADAAHSLSDVVLSGVALLSFQASRAPKDKEHPYGHGKFETLGALGISGILLVTAGGIAWHALDVLMGILSAVPEIANQSLSHQHAHSHSHSHLGGGHHRGIDMDHPVLALSMTIVAISVKEWLFWTTKRAGERAGSGLMKANAWHHRADAISSFVALVGVGGSILGMKVLDPLAGLVVSGMILKAGLETGYQSVLELVDAAVPSHHLDPIRNTLLEVEGVKGCSHLRGRRAGSSLYLDVNIEVDPLCSVLEAHEIGENVRNQIQNSHQEVSEVFIHLEPAATHFQPTMMEQEDDVKVPVYLDKTTTKDDEIEEIITDILASKFSEKMVVESMTRCMLQDKVLLQIEVSMPPDTLISDAMKVAEELENHILESPTSNAVQICFHLRLGHSRMI